MEVDDMDAQVQELIEQVEKLESGSSASLNPTGEVKETGALLNLSGPASKDDVDPVIIIMVGMAGTGKTTMTQRVVSELIRRKTPPYTINLDPACSDPPYPVNIGKLKTLVGKLES